MFRPLIITCLLLAVLSVPGMAAPTPVTAKETKRVLIIYSLDKTHPAHVLTEKGIIEEFQGNRKFEIQLYTEYLDVGRFPGPAKVQASADYLRRKYSDLKIDVIITIYPTAVDFLLKESPALFPNVPVVAGAVTQIYADNLERSPVRRRITATVVGENITSLLDSALRLKPDTQRVAVVGGTAPLDDYTAQIILNGLKRYARRLDLIDLTKLPMQEILKRLGVLPPETIVMYSTIFTDGTGQIFVPQEALRLVSRASNAPVFGIYDSYFGFGIVGGRMVSFELQGKNAANLALRIMEGESPSTIPFAGKEAYIDLYDAREIHRWNFSMSAVASDTLRYHQISLWEQYRWFIIGALCLAIVETLLIVGLVINLKRRKKAELELDESRMRLDMAADSAGTGLWSIDVKTGRIWATDRALDMYGLAPGDKADYERFLAAVHPQDRDRFTQHIGMAIRDNQAIRVEYRITLPDGSIRWMVARGKTQQNQLGETVVFIGAFLDITEHKQAEQEMEKQRNELAHIARVSTMSQLASSLAHELNQPLGAIMRNAEAGELFLQNPSPDLDEVRAIMADILRDNQRAGKVIDRMRSLLKRRETEQNLIDLQLLAGEVITLMSPEAVARKVQLAFKPVSSLPPVRGDRVHLQQVLLNLLLNAMDAMNDSAPDGRKITVSVQAAGTQVEVAVSDTGYGIPVDKLAHVFDPFFSTKPNGLGMGLAISRSIVEAHHGSIWAKNNEAGGATFTITLPIAEGDDAK